MRPQFRLAIIATALAVTGSLLLSACSSSGPAASGPAAGTSGGGTSSPAAAVSTAVPTQDVVSAIATDPAIAAELPADVRSSGTLLLGTTLAPGTSSLPHGGQVDGQSVGLDVDLRNAVAKVLGVTWDVENGTFPTIIPGVQNGKYQVGQDNFGVTKAREQVVDFATYLNDGQSFLGAADVKLDSVSSITDTCGYTIATSPGSTFQQLLTNASGTCSAAGKKSWTVQYFADSAPIFLGLTNGKVDLYFGPTLSLKYDAAHVAGTKYLGQISSTPVGFVTAKGSPIAKALSDAVNHLIATGAYAKIFAKWGVGGTEIGKSEVNPPATF